MQSAALLDYECQQSEDSCSYFPLLRLSTRRKHNF